MRTQSLTIGTFALIDRTGFNGKAEHCEDGRDEQAHYLAFAGKHILTQRERFVTTCNLLQQTAHLDTFWTLKEKGLRFQRLSP